ncbi:MAG: leucine-rich repeat protein [Marinifilaceae bacterium]|nr:leucine-rich repeat protein [Marinifilaceae bacterium]
MANNKYSIRSNVIEAIEAKIYSIFNETKNDTFLTFSKEGHYVFGQDEIEVLTKGLSGDNVAYTTSLLDFSLHVNWPVGGNTYPPLGSIESLWDVYGDILKSAEVASVSGTVDMKALAEAEKILYTEIDGMKMESELMGKYRLYKDQFYTQWEKITCLKLAQPFDANKLSEARAELEVINANWQNDGGKVQVEKALQTVSEYYEKNPIAYWKDIKARYNQDTDMLMVPDSGMQFAPSYIYPSNFNEGGWSEVTMTGEDIKKMKENVPFVFNSGDGNGEDKEVKKITFKYRSVSVNRPWLDSNVFKMNAWRFADGSMEHLGYNSGLEGRFPAYVSALVLVRDVQYEYDNGEIVSPSNKSTFHVLAYICKRVNESPCPSPELIWSNGFNMGRVEFRTRVGGQIVASAFGYQIGDCYLPVGTEVTCTAMPDYANDFVIGEWRLGGKKQQSKQAKFSFKVTEGINEVEAVWEKGMQFGDDDFVVETINGQPVLTQWRGKMAFVDMDAVSQLYKVCVIGRDAFSGNPYLQQIKIGQNVVRIERGAFEGCNALKMVVLPAATEVIEPTAFGSDNSLLGPEFAVDADNPIYTEVKGVLTRKENVGSFIVLRCMNCGFSEYYIDKPFSLKCPKCGKELCLEDAVETKINAPGYYVARRVEKADLKLRLKKYTGGISKIFVTRDFKDCLVRDAQSCPVYIPTWMFSADTQSDYRAVVSVPDPNAPAVSNTNEASGKDAAAEVKTINKEVNGTYSNIFENVYYSASKFSFKVPKLTTKAPLTDDLYSTDSIFEVCAVDVLTSAKSFKSTLDININSAINSEVINKMKVAPKLLQIKTKYNNLMNDLVLYPVWVSRLDYQNKEYVFIVDGVTGDVTNSNGDFLPKDKKKIWIFCGILAAIAIIIALLVFFL